MDQISSVSNEIGLGGPEKDDNYESIENLKMRSEELYKTIKSDYQEVLENEKVMIDLINTHLLGREFTMEELETIFPQELIPKTNIMNVITLKEYWEPFNLKT